MIGQPLDGNCITPQLFYTLAKEDKNLNSARVNISPTVLFEQGFAKALFTTEKAKKSASNGQVKRKHGKDVDLDYIHSIMTRGVREDMVCAVFVEIVPRGNSNTNVVRFFDSEMLHRFLHQEIEKPKGLLQKFVQPKGYNNNLIQAVWTPMVVVTDCRRNRHSLSDRHIPIWERAATFETHQSETSRVVVADAVTANINAMCQTVVDHFNAVDKVNISRMVCYCKTDEDNNLRLLFTTSIRLSDRSGQGDTDPLTLDVNIKAAELIKRELHQEDDREFAAANEKLKNLRVPTTLDLPVTIPRAATPGNLFASRPLSRLLPAGTATVPTPVMTTKTPASKRRLYDPMGTASTVTVSKRAASSSTVPFGTRAYTSMSTVRPMTQQQPRFMSSLPRAAMTVPSQRPGTTPVAGFDVNTATKSSLAARSLLRAFPSMERNLLDPAPQQRDLRAMKSDAPHQRQRPLLGQPLPLQRYSHMLPNTPMKVKASQQLASMGLDPSAVDAEWTDFMHEQSAAIQVLRHRALDEQQVESSSLPRDMCSSRQRRHYTYNAREARLRKESVSEPVDPFARPPREDHEQSVKERFLQQADRRLTPQTEAKPPGRRRSVMPGGEIVAGHRADEDDTMETVAAPDLSAYDIDAIEANIMKKFNESMNTSTAAGVHDRTQSAFPAVDMPPNLFVPAFMSGGNKESRSIGGRRGSEMSLRNNPQPGSQSRRASQLLKTGTNVCARQKDLVQVSQAAAMGMAKVSSAQVTAAPSKATTPQQTISSVPSEAVPALDDSGDFTVDVPKNDAGVKSHGPPRGATPTNNWTGVSISHRSKRLSTLGDGMLLSPGRVAPTTQQQFENWAELSEEDLDLVERQTQETLDDFETFVNELVYAVFSYFLLSNAPAYIEVPEKFDSFVSAPLLSSILHNLHGTVHPAVGYIADRFGLARTCTDAHELLDDVRSKRQELLQLFPGGPIERWPFRVEQRMPSPDALEMMMNDVSVAQRTGEHSPSPTRVMAQATSAVAGPMCIVFPRLERIYTVLKGESCVVPETVAPFSVRPDGVLYVQAKVHLYNARVREIDEERMKERERLEEEQRQLSDGARGGDDDDGDLLNTFRTQRPTSSQHHPSASAAASPLLGDNRSFGVVPKSPRMGTPATFDINTVPETETAPKSPLLSSMPLCPKCNACRLCCICQLVESRSPSRQRAASSRMGSPQS